MQKPFKVVVCITAQHNSHRLIDKGAKIADKHSGELHILHVQKGNNIFNDASTAVLLENLFTYGTEKGGMIHAASARNVFNYIAAFVRENHISQVVIGEPPNNNKKLVLEVFKNMLPSFVEVTVLEKPETDCRQAEPLDFNYGEATM